MSNIEVKNEDKEDNIEKDIISDEEVIKALQKVTTNPKVVNKRIDFDIKTMRRIETMLAVYKMDLEDKATNSEAFSYVIKKAIDCLFENDFKKKLEEL